MLEKLHGEILRIKTNFKLGCWEDRYKTFKSFILRKSGTAPLRKLLLINKQFALKNDGICQRWETRLEMVASEETWKQAFSRIHTGWIDPDFRFFHFKLLNLIVGVGEKLEHTKEQINPSCTFCVLENRVPPKETPEHLFFHCATTIRLLTELFQWEPMRMLDAEMNIFEFMIMKVATGRSHQLVINSIYIWTKYYIFAMKFNKKIPSIVGLKNYITAHAREMHSLLNYKGKVSDFSIIWAPDDYLNLPQGYMALSAQAWSQKPRHASVNP